MDVEPVKKSNYEKLDELSWAIGGNLNAAWPTTDGDRFTQGQASIYLAFPLLPRTTGFAEYYVIGPSSKGTDAAHYTDLGATYLLTDRIQLDARVGFGLNQEADNCFAMFPTVDDAIACAFALNAAFDAANDATPDELDIRVAIGIDHGSILLVDGNDFFGHPVNRASKLGEDLARPGEVLVAELMLDAARARSMPRAGELSKFPSVRRDLALARLSKTRDPIAKIAADLGYADTSAFYRAFVSWTGMSPAHYRRRDPSRENAAG